MEQDSIEQDSIEQDSMERDMTAANWVFVGDVGGRQAYHVGDEAMLDANLDLFRRIVPGLAATVVSADPEWTAAAYGVASVPRPRLPEACAGDRLGALLDELLADASPAGAAVQAVAAADGLVISGGGNLSSRWPRLVLERAVLALAARRRNLPVIVLGQTIGPELCPPERELVAQMLQCASWVGVREAASYALALELGVAVERLSYQLDDAAHLPPERPDGAWAEELVRDEKRPWIAVTIHPVEDPASDGQLIKALAAELQKIAQATRARLVLIPHAGRPIDDGWGDHAMGLALMRHLEPGCMVLLPEGLSARQARWLAGQAEFVVSTRYHPVVFGLAAGVPCLGVWTDDYTRVKLEGALSHAGRVCDTCSIWQAAVGRMSETAMSLWSQRAQTRADLMNRTMESRERARRRADALAETVRSPVAAVRKDSMTQEDKDVLISHLAEAARSSLRASQRTVEETTLYARSQEARAGALDEALAEARRYAESLERSRDEALRYARARDGEVETIDPAPTGLRAERAAAGWKALEAPTLVTEQQWSDYSRDGFMHLGKVLEPGELQALRQRADDLALGHAVNANVQMQLDTGGAYDELPAAVDRFDRGTMLYRKIQGLEADDLFAPLIHHPLFLEICARHYGPHAAVSIFRAMIMNKPAGQGTVLPWHQDGGDVWALDHDPLVTIWVALDPATRTNGCVEVIPGSHRLGLLSLHGSTLSEEDAVRQCPLERIRPLETEAGHAVLLHNWLIHRSGVNPSQVARRAFTMCCMDGRTQSTLTGNRFPLVAGDLPAEPYPFVRQLREDCAALRDSAARSEEYALSLEAENRKLQGALQQAALQQAALQQAGRAQPSGPSLARAGARRLRSLISRYAWRA
jgi:polysaccharide pyruvyl transferase WcaK-like protein